MAEAHKAKMKTRTALLATGLVVLLGGALVGYLYGTSTRSTLTTTTVFGSIPSELEVSASFTNHLVTLQSRNFSAVIAQYETNATVEWAGTGAGTNGSYSTSEIELLFREGLFGKALSFAIENVTFQSLSVEPHSATLQSNFEFRGNSTRCGEFTGMISAQDSFSYSTTTRIWLISQEDWNFSSLIEQFPTPGCVVAPPT